MDTEACAAALKQIKVAFKHIDLCKAFYFIMVIVNTSLQPDFVVWCSLFNFLEYYNIVWDKI